MDKLEEFKDWVASHRDAQYDPKLVVGKEEQISDLICPICLDLCREPFDCVKCDATFCSNCIQAWFSAKHSCP